MPDVCSPVVNSHVSSMGRKLKLAFHFARSSLEGNLKCHDSHYLILQSLLDLSFFRLTKSCSGWPSAFVTGTSMLSWTLLQKLKWESWELRVMLNGHGGKGCPSWYHNTRIIAMNNAQLTHRCPISKNHQFFRASQVERELYFGTISSFLEFAVLGGCFYFKSCVYCTSLGCVEECFEGLAFV